VQKYNSVIKTISKLSDIATTDIKPNSSFEKLGIDELELVELIMDLEDELNFSANEEMYEAKSIEELIKQVEQCTTR